LTLQNERHQTAVYIADTGRLIVYMCQDKKVQITSTSPKK